jgi:hypothetical protein
VPHHVCLHLCHVFLSIVERRNFVHVVVSMRSDVIVASHSIVAFVVPLVAVLTSSPDFFFGTADTLPLFRQKILSYILIK